ncbi:hypothetical protein FKW77_004096 [Venturia effusa]|uniref:SET domain-containing protein n=1 Tax=Venturia effusa TaxID=50376 RepID=A0A517L336_9PEZI|nr:hypothetical protein FKW77_004096 [Venturia effusa]
MESWTEEAGPVVTEAWMAVEEFIKRKSMQGNGSGNGSGNDDHELQHINQVRPNEEEIQQAWNSVSSTAHFILEARNGSTRKPHRRALTSVLATSPNPDYLSFLLSATLSRVKAATSSTEPATATATEWDALLQLVPDPTPYATSSCLQIALQSYLHLLALLPTTLLPSVSASAFLALAQRDSHNSFGIRSLDDGGDEFLGYGVWPVASFFNHSCSPNVGKKRVGREWEFWMSRGVEEGEELCISYLGGDEVGLGVAERRERLFETWAFECE